jgi:hypothetical protein
MSRETRPLSETFNHNVVRADVTQSCGRFDVYGLNPFKALRVIRDVAINP